MKGKEGGAENAELGIRWGCWNWVGGGDNCAPTFCQSGEKFINVLHTLDGNGVSEFLL